MKTQPQTAEEFLPSLVYKLLAQFSVSLCLRYQRVSDTPPELLAHKQSIPLAFSVLKAISLLEVSDTPTEEFVDVSGTRWAAKSKEKQAQKRKRSIHANRAPAIDVKSILEYGARVPTSKSEAATLAETVIAEQMAVLRVRIYAVLRASGTVLTERARAGLLRRVSKGIYRCVLQNSVPPSAPASPRRYRPCAAQGQHHQSHLADRSLVLRVASSRRVPSRAAYDGGAVL